MLRSAQGWPLAVTAEPAVLWRVPQQMLRKWISCVLASLIIVVAVTMFVMEPRKAIGVAAVFCLFAGFLWLYDALLGLRRS